MFCCKYLRSHTVGVKPLMANQRKPEPDYFRRRLIAAIVVSAALFITLCVAAFDRELRKIGNDRPKALPSYAP
jgi:hypothetical protein